MRESRTSGSVGALGGKPPRATRRWPKPFLAFGSGGSRQLIGEPFGGRTLCRVAPAGTRPRARDGNAASGPVAPARVDERRLAMV